MARPRNPDKQPVANAEQIMMAVAIGQFGDLSKEKKITFGAAKRAMETILAFNKNAKVDELKAKIAELDAAGRSGGIRGRIAPQIGETRAYGIQNYSEAKKAARPAIIVLPLSMFDAAQKVGAKAVAKFEKDRVVITFK